MEIAFSPMFFLFLTELDCENNHEFRNRPKLGADSQIWTIFHALGPLPSRKILNAFFYLSLDIDTSLIRFEKTVLTCLK